MSIPSIEQLTQNAARLLQESLAQAAQAATVGKGQLSALDLELARSNVRALAFVQGAGIHGAYAYLRDFVLRQAVPITATGDALDGWLQTFGLTRKAAGPSTGALSGTGLPGAMLNAGTLLQTGDGRQYVTTVPNVVAPDGTVLPFVEALQPGLAGNLAPASELSLVSPVLGIDAGFTAGGGLGSGSDAETDEQARYRLQQRLSNEPMGGSPADYARWALAVKGITRAWGLRNPGGPTTAGVVIMADGNPSGLPTPAQQRAVLDYIRDPRRGPPDELFVIIPLPALVPLTLWLTPDTPAMRAAVVDALRDLFFREAVPGGSIPHSHVVEAISGVAGEVNHGISVPPLTSGGVFTAPALDNLLMLGAVSFVPAP